MHLNGKSFGDALKCGVVERKDVVPQLLKVSRAMGWMHGVHALQRADPRRINDFADGVVAQAAGSERMALECLIVRWSKAMSIRPNQRDYRDGLIRRAGRYNVGVCSIPVRVGFRDDVPQQEMELMAYESGKRRTHVRSGDALDLDYAIVLDLVHGSAMRPNDSAFHLRGNDHARPWARP
jgi:hypothetical protein